jgi:uncharacterized alpha-E superfamily protein
MLSRVADSLFWMSRHIERSDGILRMLKVNYASFQDDITEFSWMPVLTIFSYLTKKEAANMQYDTRKVLDYMVFDKDNENSVFNLVTKARENARSVQDHITKEVWQCINEFFHLMRERDLINGLNGEDPVQVLDVLIRQCSLYYGTADITMARGEGNSFMNIGKYVERAMQSSDILNVRLSNLKHSLDSHDSNYWRYVLLSLSGFELYLKTYRSEFMGRNVVELVMLNKEFPRSVLYSVIRMHRYFESFKSEKNAENFNKTNFLIGRMKSKLEYSNSETIRQEHVGKFLGDVKKELHEIGVAFNVNYFMYS